MDGSGAVNIYSKWTHPQFVAEIVRLHAELARLRAEVERLRATLKPFDAARDRDERIVVEPYKDDWPVWVRVSWAQFKEVRAALAPAGKGGE